MKIYWSLNQIPEFAELTPSERRHVHPMCFRRHGFKGRGTIRALIACGLCGSMGVFIGLALQRAFESPWTIGYIAIGGGLGGFIGGVIFTQVLMSQLRPHYTEFMREELAGNRNALAADPRE